MNNKYFNNSLNLDELKNEVISFVGGGGKTTTIQNMAFIFKNLGSKVLCTTSTAIFKPSKGYYDEIFIGDIPDSYIPKKGSITVYGQYQEDKKLRSNDIFRIEKIIKKDIFDYILIEADGSKEKPIKAPAIYEPIISNLTTVTVGVIGMDCINKNIDIISHRPKFLKKILKVESNHILEHNDLIKLALHKNGLFKNSVGKKILFLNKVRKEQLLMVKQIEQELIDTDIQVSIGRFNNTNFNYT